MVIKLHRDSQVHPPSDQPQEAENSGSVDSNFTKSMFEFGSPLQSKPQSNNGSPSTFEAPEPLVHATYPTVVSPGSSKDAPASHMGSLLCGVRRWEVPAFQDAVECMGLGPIFDAGSPWVRRLFWTTVVILGWVLAVYQIVQQIQVYLQWPVSTMVDITHEESLAFPRVSVCNLNRIRSSALPVNSNPNATSLSDIFPADMVSDNLLDWRQVYTDSGHWLNDTILSCTFKGQPCDSQNISTIYADHGACFSYNSEGTLYAKHSGMMFGFVLEMNTQVDNYVGITDSMGFGVDIADYKIPLREGNVVAPGTVTFLQIRRRQISYLPPPWEDCGSVPLKDTPYYSRKSCHFECETDFIVDKCGCQLLSMRRRGVPVCHPLNETQCAVPAKHVYMEQGWPCAHECPTDCLDNQYDATLYYTSFSDSYIEQIANRYGEDEHYWRKNLVRLVIYYPHLTQEVVIHQQVYTVIGLLCDLGGALGLVIGASVITLIECCDHLFWRAIKKSQKLSTADKKCVDAGDV